MVRDTIKAVCMDRNISIGQLEKALGYGNGSIMKSANMSARRVAEIAHYLGMTTDELFVGAACSPSDSRAVNQVSSDSLLILKKQKDILEEMARTNEMISSYYEQIFKCKEKIASLTKQYKNL